MFQHLDSTVSVLVGTGMVGVALPVSAAFLLDSVAVFRATGRPLHLLVTLGVTATVAVAGCSTLAAGLSVSSTAASPIAAVSSRFLMFFAPAVALAAIACRYLRIRTRARRSATLLAARGAAR
jgi:hypothetical protein